MTIRRLVRLFLAVIFASFGTQSVNGGFVTVGTVSRRSSLHLKSIVGIPDGHQQEDQQKRAASRKEKRDRKKDYERRRDLWLERYGTVDALRSTFGAGPPWGDLDPQQTRSLYHTLLPRSLLALHELGLMNPEELAPLAYEARVAAKEYARERCTWTGRLATGLFDTYRNFRDYGRLNAPSSMSWEQVWEKYEAQIVSEECVDEMDPERIKKCKMKKLSDDSLTMRIYLRILERSCSTNQAFDSLFLKEVDGTDSELDDIASQLEHDVRTILLDPKEIKKMEKNELKAEKKAQKAMKKTEKAVRKAEKKRQEAKAKLKEKKKHTKEKESGIPPFSRRYQVLRVMAGNRRKFRLASNSTSIPWIENDTLDKSS